MRYFLTVEVNRRAYVVRIPALAHRLGALHAVKCPRCLGHVLDAKEQDGVMVDFCRRCRGLWLDRGQLEKLMAQVTVDERDQRRQGRPSWLENLREIFD